MENEGGVAVSDQTISAVATLAAIEVRAPLSSTRRRRKGVRLMR